MPHPSELPIHQLLTDCELKLTRGSGPGGQHRNKVETAVVLTHKPTQILGQASEQRSQNKNRIEAIRRLRINLALGVRTVRLLATYSPSQLWMSRIQSRKICVATSHEVFPALLAEALDVLMEAELDLSTAASKLGCTSSQLVKFLKQEPQAFNWLNRARHKAGLKTFK